MNHLSAALRSAHSCAVPLSHSFGFASPPGRKRPVRGRAPLPRLAPTVYYNLIVSCYPEQPTTPRSPPLKCDGGYASPAGLKSTRTQAESRRPNPESLARPRRRGKGPKTENRKPNYVFSIFAQKKNGPGTSEDRKPKAESRKLGPARPEGQGPEDRKPKTELRFCHFRQKNGPGIYLRRPKAEGRIPKAWPGPRGRGPKTENRKPNYVFAVFAKKNGLPPKTESRRPNPESLARPGPRGRGPKTENRKPNYVFAIFAKKMIRAPPKTESRKLGPAGGSGARRPKTENRITFLPFSPKKWSGYLRRPKAEGRI